MRTKSHDCEECAHYDFLAYDKYSPEEPYCLISQKLLVDMEDHHGECFYFE